MHTRNNFGSLWRPSRRDMLLVGIAGLTAAVPVARRRPLPVVRRNVIVMGTVAEFVVADCDPGVAQAAIDAAVTALRNVDDTMSRFKPSSDVGRANRAAARAAVRVSAETCQVLREGLRWAADSGGVFDPGFGRATGLWEIGVHREPPGDHEVSRLANRRFYLFLELGRHHGDDVVVFHNDDVSIDLGGIAKGYGVDRAVGALREHGVEHALVGAGGDLYALGRSPSNEPWHVGIQSPDDPAALAGSLRLEDEAVATSGDYRQYFVHSGRRYHHLLDPHTAAPRHTSQRSVSVVAPSCMAADAAATLAFGRPTADVHVILSRHGARIAHSI